MGRRYLYRDMNGPVMSAFNAPAYQQSYHLPGPEQGGQAYDYGASDYQQAFVPGGGMIQTQMQPSFAATQNPYTSAPFNTSVPAQAPAFTGQQQTTAASHVASPPQRGSPNAVGQRSQPSSHTPPTKYPMAAPPLPLTPQSQQHAGTQDTTSAVTTPKSPRSPGAQSREAARVQLLLSINRELLEEVQRLQDSGKGGAISQQQVLQFRNEGKPDKMASDEYIQCLRRVQANFAYLMPKAQSAGGQSSGNEAKQLPGPAHMTPPPHMPESMKEKYEQLRELFPEWQGLDQRMAAQQQNNSPRPGVQAGGTNGVNASAASSTRSTSTTPTA